MIAGIEQVDNNIFGFLGIAIGSISGIAVAFINAKKNKKKNVKDCVVSDLRNHDIFNTLKRTQYEVRSMKFYTDMIGLKLPCVMILQNTK